VFADLLRREFDLPDDQVAKLETHYNLLCKWNRVLNLTTIYKVEEAVERHYWEGLFLAQHLPPGGQRLVDIGSGAGFPGFPVAVVRPDCEVTLVESHQRKAVFLREAARELPNVRVVSGRAESVKEEFDRAMSRAVSYEDLSKALKSLAPAADLLTGAEDPPPEIGFGWEPPIRLPWGKHRFLRHGNRI
jgi:16S rRNA (guanine527-N7)-methyltransferase